MLFHERQEFEPWAKHLIVINSLLCTINSSCNFAFYCGDVVFRECLSAVSRSGFSKFNLKTQGQCCQSHNTIDGADDNMVEMEEVTLRASNPQSDQISRSPRSSSCKKVSFIQNSVLLLGKFFFYFQETKEATLDKIASESLASDLDPQSRLLLGIKSKEEKE